MNFPTWVDSPKTPQLRASNRLRYMIGRAAVEMTGKQSVRALAEKVAIDHSSLSFAIRRGYFTVESAQKLISAMKAAKSNFVITDAHLTDPLNIKA